MKQRVLILAIYPAPYRVELIKQMAESFETDAFFEYSKGDGRNEQWFTKQEYAVLDRAEDLKAFKSAKRRIKSYSLVVLYDYTTKQSFKLILKCFLQKTPYVLNADGVKKLAHSNFIKDRIKKIFISHAKGCLASGENAKEYFLKYGAKEENIYFHHFSTLHKEDFLTQPIGDQEKKEIRKKLGLPVEGKISIGVGRFIPLKRYGELIGEWVNMPSDHILLLVGGGVEEAAYREIIQENGLHNVILEPFHEKDELMEYYKASDVFVHPTSYDVWGLVVNEAMANGLPVIVSNRCVAGLELIENEKNGYVVEMGDEAAMCQKVISVLKDDDKRKTMGNCALNAIQDYTVENMAQAQKTSIEHILSIGNKDNY